MSIEMLSAEHGRWTAPTRCHGGTGLDITRTPGRPGQPRGGWGGPGKVQAAQGWNRRPRGGPQGFQDFHELDAASHGPTIVGAQRVPPAVTRLTVYRWPQVSPIIRSDFRVFVGFVLEILLWDLDENLRNARYMYDLDFLKVSCNSIDSGRSLTRAKPCLLYTSPSPRDRG